MILCSPQQPDYENPLGLNLVRNDSEDVQINHMSYDLYITNYEAQICDIKVKKVITNGSSADENHLSTFRFSAILYMPSDGRTIWDYDDEGIVHVKKDGGLLPGMHRIGLQQSILAQYGYMPWDEEWVKNPPVPGSGEGAGKTETICYYDLLLNENA